MPDKTPHYLRLLERDDHFLEVVKKRWWAKCFVPISYADSFRIAYLMIGGVGLVLAAWVWLTCSVGRGSGPGARRSENGLYVA